MFGDKFTVIWWKSRPVGNAAPQHVTRPPRSMSLAEIKIKRVYQTFSEKADFLLRRPQNKNS